MYINLESKVEFIGGSLMQTSLDSRAQELIREKANSRGGSQRSDVVVYSNSLTTSSCTLYKYHVGLSFVFQLI